MKLKLLLGLLSTFSVISVLGQTLGDYRSAASGNWNLAATWQRFDGTNWVAAAVPPSSTDGVISILNTHTVTMNTNVTADQLVVNPGGTLAIATTLTLADGVGTDLVVDGSVQFSGGTLGGTGTAMIDATGTLAITTASGKSISVALTNNGAIVWDGGTLGGTGTIVNNGTMTMNGDNVFAISSTFTNAGTLTKQTGTGTTTMSSTSWTNTGTINVNSGTLANSISFTNSGTINLGGGTFQNNSTITQNAGAQLTGTGNFNNGGTLTLNTALVSPVSVVFANTSAIAGAGDLTINNDFTIQGNIGGTGALTINGNSTWLNGSLGRGLTISASQTLTLNTAGGKSINALLTNNGAVVWNDGTLGGTGGVVNNGTMTLNGNNLLGNTSTFTNAGTLTKQTGTGTTTMSPTSWTNSGTINVNSGTITNSSSFTNSGSINVNGGTFQNSSTFNHNAGGQIAGTGNFSNGGTFTLNISQVFPASLVFSNTSTINGAGNLTINNDFTIQGLIGGTGTLTINGNSTWVNGTLSRALTISSGQTLTLNTAAGKSMNALLTNNGSIVWNDGTIGGSGAIVNNGTMTMNGDNVLGNTSTFTNAGTMTKQTGTGNTTISPSSWTNSGTININSGTVSSSAPLTNTGSINFSGGTFQNNNTFNLNAGSQLTGTGNFNNAATLTLNISQVFAASLVFSSTSTINGAGDLTINNDFTIQGNIGGTGALTINGNSTWVNGTLGRALTISASQTLTINTAAGKSMNALLTNNGAIVWNDGTIGGSGAIVNNGMMTINGNNVLATTSTLTNAGTITKQTGTGSTTISPSSWTNSGTINVNSGTMSTSTPITNTGPIVFNGGIFQNNNTFNHNAGSQLSGTGSFSNAGTLTLNVSLIFPATLIFSSTSTINGAGDLTINNDFTIQGNIGGTGALTINGNSTWVNGTLGRALTISPSQTLTINTAAGKSVNALLTNNGAIVWNDGTIAGSGAIANNAALTINGNNVLGNTSTLTNAGTITKQTGTGITNISPSSWTNSGTIIIATGTLTSSTPFTNAATGIIKGIGTLTNASTFTDNGTIAPGLSPGIITVTGTNPFGANSTLSIEIAGNGGAGQANGNDQMQRGENLTLNGTLTVVETGVVPNGDYTIISLSAGTVTGTFATTNLPANYTVTYNTNNVIVSKGGAACPPSVTIVASPGSTICAGTPVTFTATPTNGGATPTYQWKLNGNNVGTNSNQYQNSTLVNGDVVTVVMTSSAACANPTSATSNAITMTVTAVVVPSVSIAASPGSTICAGTPVTFTATPTNGGATPSYQWKLNGNNVGTNSNQYQNSTLVNGDVVTVVMTPSVACANPANATSNVIGMTVTAAVAPSVTIAASPGSTICAGTPVTFTATPTNGGASPSYQWKLNGSNVGTNSNQYQNFTLVNGDVVTVVMTSSFACANPANATSNAIGITVTAAVAPSVSLAASPGSTICAGTPVTFTATPTNGGVSPSYQWKLNGNNVGTNSNQYQNSTLANGDLVTVVMTSSLACANPANATSNAIGITVTAAVAPSVSIAASPGSTICTGTPVTFTATPTNGGAAPSYQWKLNGNNVGTNSNQYQNSTLVNGDVITVVMTSSLACANPAAATSNQIMMTVTAAVAPSVSIAASPGSTICTGTPVTFTATPTNGGAGPSYQWKLNGNNVGTNSDQYQNSTLVNGDVVTVVMTSSLACANPAAATSNQIMMTVTAAVAPSVSIAASPGSTICTGTPVTFTATPTNGGAGPSYQWKLNGNNVGTNSNQYQNSTLVNGDVVTVVMTSSLACANPAAATSNQIMMTVTAAVAPSVSIAASPGSTVCTGTPVTFTATPTNGGAGPSYQWKLNGNNVGTNSNQYQNSTLVNGDVVTVVMTSSLACANPAAATSNQIMMTVTATVAPSVSIAASPGNTICSGTNVTFTVTPTNGGETPSYQWKLNGGNVGTNSNQYQNSGLVNGDVVIVVMTSSIACANPSNVTSNPINIVVQPLMTFYHDLDGDGYGNANSGTIQACTAPPGYVANNTDCDDNNPNVNPGSAEICGNAIDDNCNGTIDENCNVNLPVLMLRTYPVKEGDVGMTTLQIQVTLDRPAPLEVRISYATSDDDATAGLDYVATNGVLIIPPGASSGTIQIKIIGDMLRESNERFWLNFSNPINVIISGDPRSRIMIIDDDKGRNNQIITTTARADLNELPVAIPNLVKRNHIWMIPLTLTKKNEVEIVNILGKTVFRADNYNNDIPVANVAAGMYFYKIRVVDANGKMCQYTGKLLITE